MAHVAILGGSIAGLSAAIGLARRGHAATVIERDPACNLANGEEAFVAWDRPGVPQFRQGHAFTARLRNLMQTHMPEVVQELVGEGVEEFNVLKALAPPEKWQADDDECTGLLTRRAALERALRNFAEHEAGIDIKSPAAVIGLRTGRDGDGTLRVCGVNIDDGSHIDADVVLDCGGRRSPVAAWLAEHEVVLPIEEQDCDTSYYTRYFRLNPESGLSQMFLFALRGEVADTMFVGFAGDHDAFGITLMVRPADAELRLLRHNWAWDAFARSIEPLAGWLDPATSTPITDVLVMASHKNTRRQFVVDGEPLVLGMLLVGDSLCTTNPTYGWGASMAVTSAMAAVEAIDGHAADARTLALAYDHAVRGETDSVYRESAAMDRLRMYRLTSTPGPSADADEMQRQQLIGAALAVAAKDTVLARAVLRRVNLLDRPSEILDSPEVVTRANHMLELLATKTPRKIGPTRDELSELLAAASPAS